MLLSKHPAGRRTGHSDRIAQLRIVSLVPKLRSPDLSEDKSNTHKHACVHAGTSGPARLHRAGSSTLHQQDSWLS